jgi:hypothetical protein
MKFEKGWLLEINSWENDGDMSATEQINIAEVDKPQLDWLLAIMPYFQKSSWQKGPNGETNYYVGNVYEEDIESRLREIMKDAFDKYWPNHEYYVEFPEDFEPYELLYDYGHAFLGMYENQFTRQIESFKVYEIPFDIEFKEVTV